MLPEQAIGYICGAMSLREPQAKSLKLFSDYLQSPAGQKLLSRMRKETRGSLTELLEESKSYFQGVSEAHEFETFERAFPA